jgi:branched-chain amino acid transport system permease protein
MATSSDRVRAVLSDKTGLVVAGFVSVVFVLDLAVRLISGEQPLFQVFRFGWQGLSIGFIIGLAGIGLSLTYSILNFANFAHGDYVTVGGFTGWAAAFIVAGLGSSAAVGDLFMLGVIQHPGVTPRALGITVTSRPFVVLVGLVVAIGATILVALFMDRVVFKPMRDAGGISLLIASIGVALALRYAIAFTWKTQSLGLTASQKIPSVTVPFPNGSVVITAHQVTIVLVAIALMLGLHYLLQRTKLGKAMRAMADNKDLARVTGIPTERVIFLTWVIGAGLAGAAGFLLALFQGQVSFNMGWRQLLLIFSAVILGGIGSIYGAIIGGLLIGLVSRMAFLWIPTDFGTAAAFAIMILVLLYRPEGIFGGVKTA